jgi:hypothetical protein
MWVRSAGELLWVFLLNLPDQQRGGDVGAQRGGVSVGVPAQLRRTSRGAELWMRGAGELLPVSALVAEQHSSPRGSAATGWLSRCCETSPDQQRGGAVDARCRGASTSLGTGRRAPLFAAGERGHGVAPLMLRGDPGLYAGKRDGFVQRPAPRPRRDAGRAAVS